MTGWVSFGELLENDSTYQLVGADALPPIAAKRVDGSLGWLTPMAKLEGDDDDPDVIAYDQRYSPEQIRQRCEEASRQGFLIPPAFLAFMTTRELYENVPAPTLCTLYAGNLLTSGESRLLGFLRDQQGLVQWYLMLHNDGTHEIAAGFVPDGGQPIHFVCAPSFETFLYRFWLESSIRTPQLFDVPLSEEQSRYLATLRELNPR